MGWSTVNAHLVRQRKPSCMVYLKVGDVCIAWARKRPNGRWALETVGGTHHGIDHESGMAAVRHFEELTGIQF